MGRHHLRQSHHRGPVVAGVQDGQPDLHHQHVLKARHRHQPGQARVGREHGQQREHGQHRRTPDAVRHRPHHRQQDEIGQPHAEGHHQAVGRRQLEHRLAEGGRVDGDQVERHGGHHHQHHAGEDQGEVLQNRLHDFTQAGMVLACREVLGLLQRTADPEHKGQNQATDDEGHAPAPIPHLRRAQVLVDQVAQDGREHDRHLLAGRLPAHIKAFASGRGDFRQIDRHPAQFNPGRKALHQPADQHQDGRQQPDGRVTGHEGHQHGAGGHDAQGHDQAFAAADAVDVTAQHDGPQRTHQKTRPEGGKGQQQGTDFIPGREEGLGNVGGIKAEQKEVIHLQKIAAGDANDIEPWR